jgi:hypothetical protein
MVTRGAYSRTNPMGRIIENLDLRFHFYCVDNAGDTAQRLNLANGGRGAHCLQYIEHCMPLPGKLYDVPD